MHHHFVHVCTKPYYERHPSVVKVFSENVISREMVCQWIHQLQNKKKHDVHDLAHEECPCSSLTNDSIAGVCALLADDR